MSNYTQSDRHARHLALPQIGMQGQKLITSSTALLVGLGGIGCATASYLASSGVGHLILCDFDTVDASNLGRQMLYGPADIGKLKADQVATRLASINPEILLTKITDRLSAAALTEAVLKSDVVLDGCDNFATRFQINDACVANNRFLISGAAIRFEGQIAVFGPDYSTSPCYRCLYQEVDESLDNCAGNGVLAPIPGVIGTMMAVEALKFLTAILSAKPGRLNLYDAISVQQWQQLTIKKRTNCPACT